MLDTFRHLRRVHELLGLLVAAGTLPLTALEQVKRRSLRDALCPADMTVARAAALANGPVPGRVEGFLQDLGRRLRPLRDAGRPAYIFPH